MLMKVLNFRPADAKLASVFICKVCRKLFLSQDAVRLHFPTCINPKLSTKPVDQLPIANTAFECATCKLQFKDLSSRNWHNTVVHMPSKQTYFVPTLPNANFTCEALQIHKIHVHSANKFSMVVSVNQSAKKIQQEASLECKHCGELLPTQPLLTSHLNSHSMVMPDFVNCVLGNCRSVFANAAALKTHIVAKHETTECTKCGISFDSSANLRQHIQQMHHVQKPSAGPFKRHLEVGATLETNDALVKKDSQPLELIVID
jgi:Zinc finger, C2H2 type/C2H2-type zinc finger